MLFSQAVCASFADSTEKVQSDRGHPYELPDLWLPNSSDLNPIDYKICGIIQQWV